MHVLHDVERAAQRKGWSLLLVRHTPAAVATAPGAITLCKVRMGEWATHYFNKEDGGFYHGHYHGNEADATEEWFDRSRRT